MAEKKSWLKKIEALLDERGLRSEADLTRLTKFIHFWMLLGRSFVRNRCPIRASALSYTTLLALIPMLAVTISVSTSLLRGEQGEKDIYHWVDKLISTIVPPANIETNSAANSQPALPVQNSFATNGLAREHNNFSDTNLLAAAAGTAGATNAPVVAAHAERTTSVQREAANKIHEFVQSTQSGTLGVTGMIILVVIAIRMLSQVESTFNDIWGVTRGRSWLVRIVLYWTTITLGPVLLIVALGLASGPHLQSTQALIARMPVIGHLLFPTLTLMVLWLTFALVYQLVPNTKVNFGAALIGGIVAGSLWHLNNVFGFLYVSRVVTYNKMYGSLFLVPVFMAGLYLTWFFLLFGAQVAYAFQNRTLYLQERIAENVNQRGREFVALRLMTCLGHRFQRGLPPATVSEMSAELAIPGRLVQQVLQTLIAAHLVMEIHGAEAAFAPARPLENINAHHVLQAMRAATGQELVTRDEPMRGDVYGEFARIQEAEKQAASSLTMLALVSRTGSRLAFPATKTVEDEIKIKSAMAPTLESQAESAEEKMESAYFSAEHSPDSTPGKFSQRNVRQGNETQLPVSEKESAPQSESEPKTVSSHSTVVTPGDEERDFPL